MANIIGVRFRSRGKLVHCDAGDMSLQVNDYVVVDTGHGLDVAKVITLEGLSEPSEESVQLIPVVRQAQAEDLEEAQRNLEKEALNKCNELAGKLNLNMKPLVVRYDLKSEHLTIFFSAQERVDFRVLVRKLGHALETRVELRQVGTRDEAKLLGCVGKCGYPLCCQNFLTSFASVSIKMAKEQNLALNPMKISGVCGRLLCCLSYENKEYAAMRRKMPKPKQQISTQWGQATVISNNILKETVTVQLEDEEIREIPLDQLVQGG